MITFDLIKESLMNSFTNEIYYNLRSFSWRRIKGVMLGNSFQKGFCASCGTNTWLMFAPTTRELTRKIAAKGGLSERYQKEAAQDDDGFCTRCLKFKRIRILAEAVLKECGCENKRSLFLKKLENGELSACETSEVSIFGKFADEFPENYFRTVYHNAKIASGTIINGFRHENLEKLSFKSASLDLVITSAVLEHIDLIDEALKDIHRVLKPGGLHIFSLPIDSALPSSQRRATGKGETLTHLLPEVYHGDTIREKGVLVYHDFSLDILEKIDAEGFSTTCYEKERPHPFCGVPVFVSRKKG